MEKRKKTLWQVVVFIVLEMLVFAVYFIGGKWGEEEKRKAAVIEQEVVVDYSLLFNIEKIIEKDVDVEFSGWAFCPDTKNKEIALVLRETEDNTEHILYAELKEKEGITDYFFVNEKSGKIGFDARIKKEKLDSSGCYEILLCLLYETTTDVMVECRKKISTGVYYCGGQTYGYNPKEFKEPMVYSEELVNVVKNGSVRAYNSEDGIWVYQNDSKLYCLIESNKNQISEETRIDVPVMVSTSCTELLPENRQQYGNDHLGAYFADEKYKNEEEIIQVVAVELPTEYPITYVSTGLYDNIEKDWKRQFVIPMFDWRMYTIK